MIHKLPSQKARGTDGWRNGELKLLTVADLRLLADIFNLALEQEAWPDDLCNAAVTLLAKVELPMSPKEARPITVRPTLYRWWGKVACRT